MNTPEETEWITTPQSTDISKIRDGSYRLQGDSGFHSITPSSDPLIRDTKFQQCPRCHNEFETSLNISSDGSNIITPGIINKSIGKLCHECLGGRMIVENFSHSESPYFNPLRPVHLFGHNDSETVSLCTPGSSDVSIDTSLYMEEEMEIDQFPIAVAYSSLNDTSESNIMELKYDDNVISEISPASSQINVPAPVPETTGTEKKIINSACETIYRSSQKNTSKAKAELGMIRDLPRRREIKQPRVEANQPMLCKYFQPLPLVTSFVGLENIDILYQLQQAQLGLIISKIFEYVKTRDLFSIIKVSKTWKEICYNDHAAYKRLKKIPRRNTLHCFKENLHSVSVTFFSKYYSNSNYSYITIINITIT